MYEPRLFDDDSDCTYKVLSDSVTIWYTIYIFYIPYYDSVAMNDLAKYRIYISNGFNVRIFQEEKT